MPRLYVCAPHTFCDPERNERHCDRVARMAAEEMKRRDIDHHICGYLMSDKLRTMDHDYNRPNTDGTPWRARMNAEIRAAIPAFVLEVHSFPGAHEIYQKAWPSADMTLYASRLNAAWIDRLRAEILARVPANYTVLVVHPWHPVAITDDIVTLRDSDQKYADIGHTLFEFNEDMAGSRVIILARAAYDAVLSLLASGSIKQKKVDGGADIAIIRDAEYKRRWAFMQLLTSLGRL